MKLPAPAHGWTFRAANVLDAGLVAEWMTQEHVASTWHQDWSQHCWEIELARQLHGRHSVPVLAAHEGTELAYLELYRVPADVLSAYYRHDEHDLGVHVALGELGDTGRGLGRGLLRTVATGLLAAHPECRRVVAEPDVCNLASRAAFGAAGFTEVGEVRLAGKTAALTVHPRTPNDLENLL